MLSIAFRSAQRACSAAAADRAAVSSLIFARSSASLPVAAASIVVTCTSKLTSWIVRPLYVAAALQRIESSSALSGRPCTQSSYVPAPLGERLTSRVTSARSSKTVTAAVVVSSVLISTFWVFSIAISLSKLFFTA